MANQSSQKGSGKRIIVVSLLIVIFDQLAKYFFFGKTFPIIKNIFHITYVENTGSLFGILNGMNIYLIFLSFIIFGVLIYNYNTLPWLFCSLLLGGLIGNLIDRIRLGYVIDFLDFRIWPVFNIADMAISASVVGLIVYFWRAEHGKK